MAKRKAELNPLDYFTEDELRELVEKKSREIAIKRGIRCMVKGLEIYLDSIPDSHRYKTPREKISRKKYYKMARMLLQIRPDNTLDLTLPKKSVDEVLAEVLGVA